MHVNIKNRLYAVTPVSNIQLFVLNVYSNFDKKFITSYEKSFNNF